MKYILLIFITTFFFTKAFSQKYTITGFVQDFHSGEKLPYASIFMDNTGEGVLANNYGFFSISTSLVDSVSITGSFVGYKPSNINFHIKNDTIIIILLETNNLLQEIVVTSEQKLATTKSAQFNAISFSMKDVSKIPVVLGEPDVLKSIQLMPGIKGGQEGTSGLYVRGGSPDQNLVLLDGVPVYNANHLFGFFSVFNSEALKSVNVIKGGFPSRYGGRLSSILDIQMKEGDNKTFKGDISMGFISSKIMIEGPIIKDKTSFFVSARRTYFDYLLGFLNTLNSDEKLSSGYYFYDVNAKINHKISNKNHVFLSVYSGKDKAFFDDKFSNYSSSTHNNFDLNWKNTTLALRYNHIVTKSLFANATFVYSNYRFSVNNSNEFKSIDPLLKEVTDREYNAFSSHSGIQDLGLKFDFDFYVAAAHLIKYGISYTRHFFTPEVSSKENSINTQIDTTYGNINITADEVSAFIEDDWEINSKLRANFGLRFASFFVQNKNYPVIEPRLSARYLFSDKLSIKAAYSRMNQYIHLLSNSSVGLPTDLWLPVTNKLKPMNSDQLAIGTQFNYSAYEIVAECFYKTMNNLIEYKEGTQYLVNTGSWENKIETGKGDAYGFELLFRKTSGNTTGWIGYNLSWSTRQFDNLNNGKKFPYKYDKRHDISIVLTHKFSEKADIGITWVFNTGNPVTIATQKYASVDDTGKDMVNYYSSRNSIRMPAYHRMDIGTNFYKTKKHGVRIWALGIYNLYNHTNPYIVYIKNSNGKSEVRQYTLFPILPSISYTFKF